MKPRSFGEFVNKKKRDGVSQLGILHKLLEKTGMKVESFLDTDGSDEPYIFCFAPTRNGSFDGVRIYKVGDQIAFRVQKENKTHPYGAAYPINVEEMFHDFLADEEADKQKAGMQVIESVSKEVKKFFEKSVEAEKDERKKSSGAEDEKGAALVRTTGTDYSSLVYNKA